MTAITCAWADSSLIARRTYLALHRIGAVACESMGEAIDGPVWLDVWANVQVAVILVPLIVYSIMKYSHTSGPQFGKFLSALNLAAAVLSLILQVIVVIDPRACAFFFHETIFSVRDAQPPAIAAYSDGRQMADFSLYHFRTAIFYQSNVRFYRILKWVFNVQNACFAVSVTCVNRETPDG